MSTRHTVTEWLTSWPALFANWIMAITSTLTLNHVLIACTIVLTVVQIVVQIRKDLREERLSRYYKETGSDRRHPGS